MVKQILEGYRVLDMTHFQLGPVNTLTLALMGAEVIKIEPPTGELGRRAGRALVHGSEGKGFGGLGQTAYFETNNQCKLGLVLDLKRPKAMEILYQLAAKSDVFAQNMRPGVCEELGCGYEDLKKYNPRIIYYSGSSFGTKGPDGKKAGMDGSGRARSGWMYQIGLERNMPGWDEPQNHMGGASDQIGAIIGAMTILSALLARERHGIGQACETSHLAASMWLMQCQMQSALYNKQFTPVAPRSARANPASGEYKCADNEWLILISPSSRTWEPLCEALGIPASVYKDARFATEAARVKNAKEGVKLIQDAFLKKTRAEWIKAFEGKEKDIIWEKVQRWEDLPTDAQVIANEYMSDYTHPLTGETYKHVNVPMKFSETPVMRFGPAPQIGEHTEYVLTNILGYKKADVPKLLDEIGRPNPAGRVD